MSYGGLVGDLHCPAILDQLFHEIAKTWMYDIFCTSESTLITHSHHRGGFASRAFQMQPVTHFINHLTVQRYIAA